MHIRTFTRKIRHYVNEERLLSLGEALRRCTGLVADTYGIKEVENDRSTYSWYYEKRQTSLPAAL